MKRHTTLSILLVFVATWCSAQDSELIRWNLKAGDKLQATHEQTTKIETSIDNRRKEIGNDMLLVVDWEVDKVDGEKIEMTQSINQIRLEIRRPSKTAIETTIIDTESSVDPGPGLATELNAQISSLIGTEFKVVLTTRGEIIDVSLPETSKAAIRAAPASMLLRQVLTTDGLKEVIGQSAITFPKDNSQTQWTTSSEKTNALGKLRKATEIKYEGKSDHNSVAAHTFDLKSSAETIEPAKNDDAPTMDDYSGWGNAWYTPEANKVYESEFENRMNLTRRYRDQKITSSVSTTNKMRVVRK